MTEVAKGVGWELRLGRYQDVLADVERVDAVICDPPYSPKVHGGYRSQKDMVEARRKSTRYSRDGLNPNMRGLIGAICSVPYAPFKRGDVADLVSEWAPRTADWFVVFGDHVTWRLWAEELEAAGWYVFAPLGWVRTGGTPRFQGDGPACSIEWICAARPKRKTVCGSLPGHYIHDLVKGNDADKVVTGTKPIALMRAIIRDYTRPGDLVCDPCAGGGTTLLAACLEGRRAIGAEMDPETFAKAAKRLERVTLAQTFDPGNGIPRARQTRLDLDPAP